MKLELKSSVKLWQVTFDNGYADIVFVVACDIESAVSRFKETYQTYAMLDVKMMTRDGHVYAYPVLVDDGVIDQVDIAESEPEEKIESHKEFVTRINPGCQPESNGSQFWIYDPFGMGFLSVVSDSEDEAWSNAAKMILENQTKVGEPYDRDKADAACKISKEARQTEQEFVLSKYPKAYLTRGGKDRTIFGIRCQESSRFLSDACSNEKDAWHTAAVNIKNEMVGESKQSDEEFVKANAEYALTTQSGDPCPCKYDLSITVGSSFSGSTAEEAFARAAKWIREGKGISTQSDEDYIKKNCRWTMMSSGNPTSDDSNSIVVWFGNESAMFQSSDVVTVWRDTANWLRNLVEK